MAKINSIVMGRAKGSIGNVTLKQLKGETIASQKRAASSMLPTYKQVQRLVMLSNIVNAYQMFNEGKGMAEAFPNRDKKNSVYNEFVSKNLANALVNAITLTKQQAAANVIVPAPFVMSEGDLDSLFHQKLLAETTPHSITIADFFGTSETVTTWGQVSELIIGMDAGYRQGDVLTVVGMEFPNSAGAVVKMHRFHKTIDIASTDTSMIDDGKLTFYPIVSGNKDFAVAIVGRAENGKYRVSSSQFSSAIAETTPYTAQLERKSEAEESYGYREDPYLQENSFESGE